MGSIDDVSADHGITDGPFGSNLKSSHYTDDGPRVIRLQKIGDGVFRDERAHISSEHFESLRKHEVFAGDVIVASLGEVLPRACRAPFDLGPAIVKADCIRIRPGAATTGSFLMHTLNGPRTRTTVAEQIQGVGRPRINLGDLRRLQIPVPPLAEQHRIVAAIEEAFSKLDAGEAGLRATQQRLKRMRASVLNGLIGESDRVESVDEVCDLIVDCPHSTAKFVRQGRPCVDTTCIEPGRIVMSRLRFVSDETWVERVRRTVPAAGDVVFAREGTIGTAVAIPPGLDPCLGQRVMLLRPSSTVTPKYLEQTLMSEFVRRQYRPLVNGSTAPHLNVRDVKRLGIPLPPLAEQHRIVAEVERQFSFIEAAERAVEAGLARSAALRRSVLKSAFEGKLVPQDPSDEPASVLLERIRAERAAAGPPTRRSRKKAAEPAADHPA